MEKNQKIIDNFSDQKNEKNKILIKIIEAQQIPAMDMNYSDCFCEVTVAKHTKKTKTVKKSLSPVWIESFEFDFYNFNDTVHFESLFFYFFVKMTI